jgi:hypothetical protein
MKKLEAVQRKITKFLRFKKGQNDFNYAEKDLKSQICLRQMREEILK